MIAETRSLEDHLRAARIAGAVVVIISEEPARLAIALDPTRPIDRIVTRVRIGNHRAVADVFSDLSAVAAGIQRCDDAATVWSNPVTDVERDATRRFLDRPRTTNWRR